MTIAALIVAAGRGERTGQNVPKQYMKMGAKTVLHEAITAFANHPRIDTIAVVINPADQELYEQAVAGLPVLPPCYGGATRQTSVRNGLEYLLQTAPPDQVLIHDAARPFVTPELITRVIVGLEEAPAIIPVLPVTDSIKAIEGKAVADSLDRASLVRAQTPQGFNFTAILDAHRQFAAEPATDDAELAQKAGMRVLSVPGEETNLKITTPDDITNLGARAGTPRVGMGFDVHALGEGSHVRLCGIDVPHWGALVGHSDADVALHALSDALFGAIGAGDIGHHFPPADNQWKNADSSLFVKKAASLVADAGGRIINIDITIICEEPKIAPHAAAMKTRVGEMLGISVDRVSVKATTTESLGVTGQGKGIAAQAIVSIAIP